MDYYFTVMIIITVALYVVELILIQHGQFDTLEQRNARAHISHNYNLLQYAVSMKNVLIGNRGCK